MKKTALFLAVGLMCISIGALSQEKEKSKESAPSTAPPKPLDDEFCTWMVGEWEGSTTSPMGKSKDWQKVEWSLDKQFVTMTYSSQIVEMTEEQKKKAMQMYGMSKDDIEKMTKMAYKGMGPVTIDPATGDFVGYWFDNWRGTYKGSGKRQGNKVTMRWEGAMGVEDRTMEKVSDDKMTVSFKSKDPKGNVSEGKTELTRKKGAAK